MPDAPKLLLDLDRTLFDTGLFIEILWPWIGSAYGIDIAQAKARSGDYVRYVGDMYDYDFFSHMAALGIDGQQLIGRAQTELGGTSFVFDDVQPFLDSIQTLEPAILTFGTESYQSFKLSLCPQIASLPVYSTLVHKNDYILEHWPDQPTVLVDDKFLAGSLPLTTTYIHLDRGQAVPVIEHDIYYSVRCLTDIRQEWLAEQSYLTKSYS